MKLLLLKTLLQRRARDEGFTLPMVIALGLVMLLLAAVSITTANEENLTAITQNSRSDALAVAEVGVARYRELLDRNRVLTLYDSKLGSEQWAARTDVCEDDITSFVSGATPQDIKDSQDLDNDGDTDEIIGSFSLVSYVYSGASDFNQTDDTANSDAKGILKVKGATPDGGVAQIETEIPIRINLADMTNLAPALWVGNSGITATNLGNLTIGNGNIVIKDQAIPGTGGRNGCRNFADTDTTDGSQNLASSITFPVPPTTTPPTPRGTVISDSRDLPPITKITTDKNAAKTLLTTQRAAATPAKANPNTINPLPTVSSGQMIFGTTSHDPFNPDANNTNCSNIKLCRYYYEFGSTTSDLTSDPTLTSTIKNTDLLTDGIARTTLVLNQPLTINAAARDVKIGSTSPVANDSNGFEIYVNGNNNITIDVASGRTVTINGFIHARQSTLTITGSGTVNINGSVWVNDFVNTTATVNISPDTISREATTDNPSTLVKGYEFYSTTSRRTARPITGSPTNWKTEQVN